MIIQKDCEILTKKEAVRRHRELWNYLAEYPSKTKYVALKDLGYTKPVRSDCWCCEYAFQQKLKYAKRFPMLNIDYCLFCPIQFSEINYEKKNIIYKKDGLIFLHSDHSTPCIHGTSSGDGYGYYRNYVLLSLTRTAKRSIYAKQIAELPERAVYNPSRRLIWLKFAKEA